MTANFIGKDGFNWWYGVVEDRDDPLHAGRCKVRMFGHHTEDINVLPTKDLPWTMCVQSPNGVRSFGVPDEGDFVFGFFQDGKSSQSPVMMGVLPGIITKTYDKARGFSPQGTQYTRSTMPPGEKEKELGQSTTPNLAKPGYSYEFTKISKSNKNLAHACDLNLYLNIDLGLTGLVNPVTAIEQAVKNGKLKAAQLVRMAMMKMNQYLRQAVDAIVAAMGSIPGWAFSFTWSEAKAVIRKINRYTKEIAEFVETASMIANFAKQIDQVIAYFKSLPDRLLAIVQDCITRFLKTSSQVATQLKNVPGAVGNNVQSLLDGVIGSSQSTLNGIQKASTQKASNTANTIASTSNVSIETATSMVSALVQSTQSTDTITANNVTIVVTQLNAATNTAMNNVANSSFDSTKFKQP